LRSLFFSEPLTIYFNEEVTEQWYSDLPNQRGVQAVYSDLCIETVLMLKAVFKLGYRQAQGFAESLPTLTELSELTVPCYTQVCRRAASLDVAPFKVPDTGPVVVAIDSTGLKVYGEGEWKVRKHGCSKRRTWRKLHLGADPETGFVHCHALTLNGVDDGSQLEGQVGQVGAEIEDVCLDGAYGHEDCWDLLVDRNTNPIIPPRGNAVEWYLDEPGDLSGHPRNVAIKRIGEIGKKEWKKEVGYHRRSLSETAMSRYKTIHGNKLYSRTFRKQRTENSIKIKVLNIMTAQGMPVSKPRIVA